LDYLAKHHPEHEVIVVDDGSSDETASVVEELAAKHERLRLIALGENRGKGAAVREGMLAARGAWHLFMDADLSTPIEEIEKLLRYAEKGWEVVIGSRGLPTSDIRRRQPRAREMMGRTFNVLVRSLLVREFRDTQCGFKLFSSRASH